MHNDHTSLEQSKIICVRKHGTNMGALWCGFKAAGFYQGLERLMTLTVYFGKLLLVETILMVKLFRTKHLFLTYRPLAFYTQYHETHDCYMLQIALQVGVHISQIHITMSEDIWSWAVMR